jgi:hypothetical protein
MPEDSASGFVVEWQLRPLRPEPDEAPDQLADVGS